MRARCALICVSLLLLGDGIAHAIHITTPAVNILRTKMANEGYLSFIKVPNGDERTGWTDVRHPSLVGQARGLNDRLAGFDRSDHFVKIETHLVQDDALIIPNTVPAIPNDFDFASRVWVQAGLGVLEVKHDTVRVNGVTFPIDPGTFTFGELGPIFDAATSDAPLINAWYITDFEDRTQFGETNWPSSFSIRKPGFAVSMGRNSTTFAHELGHFLLDTPSHTSDPRNIMADGNIRYFPGRATAVDLDGTRIPPWNIANSLDVVGMPMSNNPDGSPKVGGVDQVTRIQARDATTNTFVDALGQTFFFPNPYVLHSDHHFEAADIADFDWVEDNMKIEGLPAPGDNHPANDFLIWAIGPIAPPEHPAPTADNGGHDHDDWGKLALGNYRGTSFSLVDVVSQIARYADSDIDVTGARSRREAALDYDIWFSPDAVVWTQAFQPITIFEPGWTNKSTAEDYIARWRSPVANARFVRIKADDGGFHDANTQIDALIAARYVPEPSTLAIAACLLSMIGGIRRTRRCK